MNMSVALTSTLGCAQVTATARTAGMYNISVTHGSTVITTWQLQVVAGEPWVPACTAVKPSGAVQAGTLQASVNLSLVDQWGNAATAQPGLLAATAVRSNTNSSTFLPTQVWICLMRGCSLACV
jgi:hypothetical protein